ncbi:quinolinate phosphoribosyl transferase [Marinococcus halophilus]|uniref:Oxidoreductase n=1 Tax=Marinococcus halophilus TaxID=1371 RepID=A0A510Y545_MARHA|nr:Gfo/Idh/MocA family oxidoreductase [Marinococcus halophilus]OZT80384.1 quinolinate phosphoribosyl transferase [Marinococcus halophilus]GEK58450.1 oxidoreductase [Marinococcus halophilus]
MEQSCRIVLAGTAGYGELYLQTLKEQNRLSWLEGVIDIFPEKSSFYQDIQAAGVPVYESMEAFYAEREAELAVIATPIHLHAGQAVTAMKAGSNVLCEKPASASWEEAEEMRRVRDETGKFLAIGFNWSFSNAVLEFKEDIQAGRFGRPLHGSALVLWPRNDAYYARSSWAGKKLGAGGAPIFDSVANNATAHFMHNLFYVLGDTKNESAKIDTLEMEVYRANPIETFDTCALRAITDRGVDLAFFASHAVEKEVNPSFYMEFEEAVVSYEWGKPMKAVWHNGTEKSYNDPESEHMHKLNVCIDAVLGHSQDIRCGIEASYSHLLTIESVHQMFPESYVFGEEEKQVDASLGLTYIPGLAEVLETCYAERKLPGETTASWARGTKRTSIDESRYPY